MIQSSSCAPHDAQRSASSSDAAPSVNSFSLSEAYASDSMPARLRSLPMGMANARSTSTDGTVREPVRNPEETTRAGARFFHSVSQPEAVLAFILALLNPGEKAHRGQDFYLLLEAEHSQVGRTGKGVSKRVTTGEHLCRREAIASTPAKW